MICFLGMPQALPDEGRVTLVVDSEVSVPSFVKKIFLETPLLRASVAKEIAWGAVLQKLSCHAAPGWEEMKRQIEECHCAAHLILSEVSDFGVEAFTAARANWRLHPPFRDFWALRGSFPKIPALICGAGASLREAAPFLKQAEEDALIFAAGSAFTQLAHFEVSPHAVCALDKRMVPPSAFSDVPLFMQSRLNPEVVSLFRGEKILVPESGPLPWERWWLDREDQNLPFGWTAGNFALQIAVFLGCDPIVMVGMDFCYRDGKKYAHDQMEQECSDLIQVRNGEGKSVWTQRDWVMAAHFCNEVASQNRDRTIINTSVGGLSLGPLIKTLSFSEAAKKFSKKIMPGKHLDKVLKETELLSFRNKEEEWEESLKRCGLNLEGNLSDEPVYWTLLEPLWNIWRPLFAREAEGQDLDLHRILFFQQVLKHQSEMSGRS